jgi:hypothetical protein
VNQGFTSANLQQTPLPDKSVFGKETQCFRTHPFEQQCYQRHLMTKTFATLKTYDIRDAGVKIVSFITNSHCKYRVDKHVEHDQDLSSETKAITFLELQLEHCLKLARLVIVITGIQCMSFVHLPRPYKLCAYPSTEGPALPWYSRE